MRSRLLAQVTAWGGREHCRERVMDALFALNPARHRIRYLWGVTQEAGPWPGYARLVGAQDYIVTQLPGPAEVQGALANTKRWAALASWLKLWACLRAGRYNAALLVDDDIVVKPDTLARLALLGDSSPDVGAVSAVTRAIDGGMSFWDYASDNLTRLGGVLPGPAEVGACGAFCLYLTPVGLAAMREGNYSPSMGVPGRKLAGHDVHLTDWLTVHGLRVLVDGDAKVEHHAVAGIVLGA